MFRSTRATALSTALAAALLLAACGSDASSSGATGSTAAPATTIGVVTIPATIVDGPATTEALMTDAPSKIVSLSPSSTEILFAIGAGDQVIAVDDQSNYPAEAEAKMTDLSGFTPNVEAIAAYEPDLVVHDGSTDLGSQLDALHIANFVGAAPTTFDDIYTQIEQLGVATGHVAEAAELVAQMQTDIAASVAAVPTLDKPPSFYHELDPTFFSVTSNTFIGQVYGLFGLRNIADTAEGGTDYPQLSAEFIISQNPDLVFLADGKCCGESVESVSARAGWNAIGAVSTGNVVLIDDDVASRWGPRVVDLVATIGAAVSQVATMSAG
ncbi:MAG: hypothetical protein RLZZ623_3340 [Actinomycetota bacterium]|jgi:iron complex transport system substrate-binding protein